MTNSWMEAVSDSEEIEAPVLERTLQVPISATACIVSEAHTLMYRSDDAEDALASFQALLEEVDECWGVLDALEAHLAQWDGLLQEHELIRMLELLVSQDSASVNSSPDLDPGVMFLLGYTMGVHHERYRRHAPVDVPSLRRQMARLGIANGNSHPQENDPIADILLQDWVRDWEQNPCDETLQAMFNFEMKGLPETPRERLNLVLDGIDAGLASCQVCDATLTTVRSTASPSPVSEFAMEGERPAGRGCEADVAHKVERP